MIPSCTWRWDNLQMMSFLSFCQAYQSCAILPLWAQHLQTSLQFLSDWLAHLLHYLCSSVRKMRHESMQQPHTAQSQHTLCHHLTAMPPRDSGEQAEIWLCHHHSWAAQHHTQSVGDHSDLHQGESTADSREKLAAFCDLIRWLVQSLPFLEQLWDWGPPILPVKGILKVLWASWQVPSFLLYCDFVTRVEVKHLGSCTGIVWHS